MRTGLRLVIVISNLSKLLDVISLLVCPRWILVVGGVGVRALRHFLGKHCARYLWKNPLRPSGCVLKKHTLFEFILWKIVLLDTNLWDFCKKHTLFHVFADLDNYLNELSNIIYYEKSTLSLNFPDAHTYPRNGRTTGVTINHSLPMIQGGRKGVMSLDYGTFRTP